MLAAVVVALYLLWRKGVFSKAASTEPIEPAQGPPLPAPTGPMQAQGQSAPVSYDPFSGVGGQQVNARMRALWNNATERNTIIAGSGLTDRLYQGLQYPNGVKNAMAAIFGSSSNVPLAPETLEPGYTRRVKEWKDVPGFESLTSSQGGDPTTAFSTWKNALLLQDQGLNFWPPNIAALIEAKEFGEPSRGDKNRSERYDAFTKDMKALGQNIAFINTKLNEIVRDRAISDLRAAGWAFIGYDAPNTNSVVLN